MTRNHTRISPDKTRLTARRWNWTFALYWCVTVILTIVTWQYLRWFFPRLALDEVSAGGFLSLIVTHISLTISLERSLFVLSLKPGWRYRIAFLISLLLAVTFWFVLEVIPSQGVHPWFPFILFGTGFIGALLATILNEKFLEDNYPPSEGVKAEVLTCHQEVIGSPGSTPWLKRFFDFSLASFALLLLMPIWATCIIMIWCEDPGPILFVKNSTGKGGRNFRQFKFRTMIREAEDETGPVLSYEGDERVLVIGRLLRKTALDELPQLINILKGEMSFVGPRPQRTILVQGYLEKMPEYAQRHKVLPGLSGLAQVAGDYSISPRQKLRFDRLYIRHQSIAFDVKLLFLAFLITFWYRWHRDWNGRLPRKFLRFGTAF